MSQRLMGCGGCRPVTRLAVLVAAGGPQPNPCPEQRRPSIVLERDGRGEIEMSRIRKK